MDVIDKVRLMAELHKDYCCLNHGPDTSDKKVPAADYIVMSFGFEKKGGMEIAVRELVMPVCFECVRALKGNEWTLLYCFECTHNRWVYRKLAKNNYRHHILWLRGCPDCSNKFGGLYFTDIPALNCSYELALNDIKQAV